MFAIFFCLSVFQSFCFYVLMSFCLSVYLSNCLSAFLSIHLSVLLSFWFPVSFMSQSLYLSCSFFTPTLVLKVSFCLSVFLSVYLSCSFFTPKLVLKASLSVSMSFCLSICLVLSSNIGLLLINSSLPVCIPWTCSNTWQKFFRLVISLKHGYTWFKLG